MRKSAATMLAVCVAAFAGAAQAAIVTPGGGGAFLFSANYSLANPYYNVPTVIVNVVLDPSIDVDFTGSQSFGSAGVWDGDTYQSGPDFFDPPTTVVETATGYQLTFSLPTTDIIYTHPNNSGGERWWLDRNIEIFGAGTAGAPFNVDITFTDVDRSRIPSPAPEPASWGLMILGFGAAGATVRSHRRRERAA